MGSSRKCLCVKNKAAAEENSIQKTQGRRLLLLLLSVCIVAKVASTFGTATVRKSRSRKPVTVSKAGGVINHLAHCKHLMSPSGPRNKSFRSALLALVFKNLNSFLLQESLGESSRILYFLFCLVIMITRTNNVLA